MMSFIEEYVIDVKDKSSKIPKPEKNLVTSLLTVLPYLEGQERKELMQEINSIVDPVYTNQILNSKNPLLDNICDDLDGEITLGNIFVGDYLAGKCKIKINDLIQSALIAAPNKGKTRLLFTLIREIIRLNEASENKISIISLDRKKDFRNAGPEYVVLSLDDLGINFFDPPPGCEPRKWLSEISQLLMSRWGFYYRSRNYFLSVANNLYESKQKPPTLLEIGESMKEEYATSRRSSPRKLEVVEVNLDRIENTITEFGRCIATRKTFSLYEFIDSGIPLVIEADVSNDCFGLLLGWLLLYIYRYRKANDLRGNLSEGGTVVICDEAYLLWEIARDYSESRRELGADFVSTAPLFIRDFRTAIVAASQRPLSADFMATTNLKIVGYCGDYDDAKYLASSLGDPDLVDMIPKLKPRQYIVKIGDKKPALLQTTDYELQKVDDAELKERMKPFVEYIHEFCKEEEPDEQTVETSKHVKISDDAKKILFDVLAFPESTISTRYSRLNFKGRRAQQVVEEILNSKYADLVVESIEGSKAAKYLVLTQQAIDWMRSQGKDVTQIQHIGRVSAAHALYQNIIQVYLKKSGWNVFHDYFIKNKCVDVYAEKYGQKTAYEIALNYIVDTERVVSSLAEVDEYIFLCKDMAIANTIRSQITIQNSKIKYFVASQYLTGLKKDILDYYSYNTQNNSNNEKKQNSTSSDGEQQENRSNNQLG